MVALQTGIEGSMLDNSFLFLYFLSVVQANVLNHALPFLSFTPRFGCLLLQAVPDGQHKTAHEGAGSGCGRQEWLKDTKVSRFISVRSIRYASQLLWPWR